MNEDKRHNANKKLSSPNGGELDWDTFKKLPPLNVGALDWTQDRQVFERIIQHGSREDKNQLHKLVLGFQRINDILKKAVHRNSQ